MSTAKILVVDDDPAVRNLIHRFLSKQEYTVESAEDGKNALTLFDQLTPDLVILDVNLPDTTGYSLCQEMQDRTGVFVMMLTNRSDEDDIVTGFQRGADDYLTKPFSLVELGARVAAVLKRQRIVTPATAKCIEVGSLSLDPSSRKVSINEQPIALTALEFDLLHFLASHPNRVWRRSELLQEVWDYDYVGEPRVVDVHIGQIRRKMEAFSDEPSQIQTVRGVGYKFEVPS